MRFPSSFIPKDFIFPFLIVEVFEVMVSLLFGTAGLLAEAFGLMLSLLLGPPEFPSETDVIDPEGCREGGIEET